MSPRQVVTEFIGTFFLIFTVGTAVLADAALAPLAIGSALMVMVYAGGHISGAHYNPAVTLAATLRGRTTWRQAVGYWVAQLLAAPVAAWVAVYVSGKSGDGGKAFTGSAIGTAFTVELLFTFALAHVVLNVATSRDHPNNSFYGLAIGFTVLTGAIAVGGISGGAFNPAVALGVSVMRLSAWSNLWVLALADLIGGALAAITFTYLNPDDK